MVETNTINIKEKRFRDEHLFSVDDIIKSFEMFIEHVRLNEFNKCSPTALKNRLKLCEKFLDTLQRCKLPVLTQLYDFYQYSFQVSRIALELCDASEFDIVDDEINMTYTVEHTLLNIECEYLTIDQFANLHEVDAKTVNQWISRGKLRYAKKAGQDWLIPETEDKPSRRYKNVHYLVKFDKQITSNDFPTLALVDSVFIHQDDTDKKKYTASFMNYKSGYRSLIDLSKDEAERLEFIIIESGKAEIGSAIQYVPYIRDE